MKTHYEIEMRLVKTVYSDDYNNVLSSDVVEDREMFDCYDDEKAAREKMQSLLQHR